MTTTPDRDRLPVRRNANAAKLLTPAVHWGEGMLLAPQHFQTAAVRGETLPYYHAAAISPFHWGLMDLQYEFGDGVLTVTRVEAVMPDGLVIRYPHAATRAEGDNDLKIKLADFEKDFKDGRTPLVFLAVASRDSGERFAERYDHKATDSIAEDVTGEAMRVDILKPRLRLVLRERDNFESLFTGFPIAKFGLVNGVFVKKDYIPPWLRVAPGSELHELCTKVRSRLRDTASSLARRIEGQSASTHGMQLLERRMLLNALVSALPPLEVLLESGAMHPFTLYLGLASILGSVSTNRVPVDLAAYDHDDVLPRFSVAIRAIERTLEESVQENYATWAFHFDSADSRFHLRLKEAWLGREMVLGVRIPRGRTREDVHTWIMGATIASSSRIEDLFKRRTLGAARIYVTEHELIPMSGVAFYRLAQPFAETEVVARAGEELVIANSSAPESLRPEEILLYVRKEVREPREPRIPQVEV